MNHDLTGAIQQTASFLAALMVFASVAGAADESFAPPPDERQLPTRMHSAMKDRPRVTVGQSGVDIVGTDQRALQSAVDYVAGLGGGIFEIGAGTYMMHDSLHLRPHVTVRGVKGRGNSWAVLHKTSLCLRLISAQGKKLTRKIVPKVKS